MPFIPAVLIVSVIWFVWHLPLWTISFTNQTDFDFLPFAVNLTVASFAMGALFKVSKSPILCMFHHAWGNAIGAIYEWKLFATFPINATLLIYDVIIIITAITVVMFTTRKNTRLKQGFN